tara:strand:+ start:2290 stop:3024 length:735 start_codon:yes stop_codon:yes gene_type:complete
MPDGQMNRVPEISKYLLTSSADVIVLQEAFHRKARQKLISVLSDKYPFHTQRGPVSFWGVSSGLLIFSNKPILNQSNTSFSRARVSDRLAKKGVISIKIEVNNQDVHIFGTHLQTGGAKKSIEIQKAQLKTIESLVKKTAFSSLIIYAGDFNIHPDEKIFEFLSNRLSIKLPVLDSVYKSTANYSDQDLYPVEGDPVWIDYVFLKTTTRGKQIRTWIEEPRVSLDGKSIRLSDHNPIFSVLEIN